MAKYTLPELPYPYDALEPYIDEETMRVHHTKHHQTYIDKLNAAMEGETLADKSVEELLEDYANLPERIQKAVRNHGGGHANHSLFWKILTPNQADSEPRGPLGTAVEMQFGSFDQLKEIFKTTAVNHFGSGWAWIVIKAGERKSKDQKKLLVLSLPNQDSPLMGGHTPILGLDLWEHAYYLKYQNRRADYIEAFWNVVNWKEVENSFGNVESVAIQTGMFKGRVLER
ncbi:MAG TPA: superoxide dismutase [Actinomycetota bacterium]|nr:superoxide dismutase [Actinomycetota bacterium]